MCAQFVYDYYIQKVEAMKAAYGVSSKFAFPLSHASKRIMRTRVYSTNVELNRVEWIGNPRCFPVARVA